MKYFFLVMALNEEKFLNKTLNELKQAITDNHLNNYEIIIIDDGSTDNTYKIAMNFIKNNKNIRVVKNPKNLGLAKNIKLFINKSSDDGKLILVSGDNDLNINLINRLIVASRTNELVLSYFVNREKKGYFRATISTLFNFICCTLFGVYAFYLQGPFVWPMRNIRNLSIYSNGIAYVSEVNIKLLLSGLKFTEIPGLMNTGSDGSTSIKLKNLVDIFFTLIHLIKEIYVLKKYKKKINRNLHL
tara:strand:- start:519 stop:1250 length:732 start_codon:yes stop_codon:yes gene_type:complete